jgi:hypothetical protein
MIKKTLAIIMLSTAPMTAALANCGQGYCEVGTYGSGGASSGGSAQGGLFIGEEVVPGGPVVITNAGNSNAGNITFSGAVSGFATGTYRNGALRERSEGPFGECTGFCPDDLD